MKAVILASATSAVVVLLAGVTSFWGGVAIGLTFGFMAILWNIINE